MRRGRGFGLKRVIYARNRGYTCLVGQPHHGSQWLPKRFQAQSRQDYAAMEKAFQGMSKQQLVTYLQVEHKAAPYNADVRMRKDDLVRYAMIKQYERMYPYRRGCDRKTDKS